MGKAYFLTQEATMDILSRVTNVCGECYSEIKIGDTIYYDMQKYRYICTHCQEKVLEAQKDEQNEEERLNETLF